MKYAQKEYFPAVRAFFTNQLNVGIIGGKPREAFYLVGVQGEQMIYLDPHTTLEAMSHDQIEEGYMTYHEGQAKKIPFSKLDPCMTFGFYIKSSEDFTHFIDFLEKSKID